jgi:hypothetical protein
MNMLWHKIRSKAWGGRHCGGQIRDSIGKFCIGHQMSQENAGFTLVREKMIDSLKENYSLKFRKN